MKKMPPLTRAEFHGAEVPMGDLYYTILNSYFELNVASFGVSTRNVPNKLIEQILA